MNGEADADPKRVEAAPEKLFFISMLTKDIEMIPAIADLVDNSVDGAKKIRPDGNYEGLTVQLEIDADGDSFRIEDNCGGIEANVARQYAFRFGRPVSFTGVEGSVGQFGVGMKRAMFKLGRAFRVESTHETSRFVIDEDVDHWAEDNDPDWSFEFEELEEPWDPPQDAVLGTSIEITRLNSGIKDDLGLSQTVGRLRTHLRIRHQRALLAGLTIQVGEDLLVASTPELLFSDEIHPISRSFDVSTDDGIVGAKIIAGVVGSNAEDRERDDGDAEDVPKSAEAGWNLFCNGRLVLAAEKSRLTGWGVAGNNAYHPQYRLFRGYVFLEAADSKLLPWNTTKTGVDEDSPVFRAVQSQMEIVLKDVQALLDAMKKERQYYEDENDMPLNAAIAAAEEKHIDDLPDSETIEAPDPAPRPSTRNSQRIHYSVDRDRYEAVYETLGAESPGEVGLKTFERFYDDEV